MRAHADHHGYQREYHHSRVRGLVELPGDDGHHGRRQHLEQLIRADGVVLQGEIGEHDEGAERNSQWQNLHDRHALARECLEFQTNDQTQRGEGHLNGRQCHGFDLTVGENVLVQKDDADRGENIRCTSRDHSDVFGEGR